MNSTISHKVVNENVFEYFRFRTIFGLSAAYQIAIVTILYISTTLGLYFEFRATGKTQGYAPSTSILFVPIYEEMLFRGITLKFFENNFGKIAALISVSILFGVWHLKNIFWLDQPALINQILYTALVFSPITCWLTLKTRSIWPAVVLHYLNNFPLESWLNYLRGLH